MSEKTQIVRIPLSKRLRFEVFKRDGFECQYCGATPPGVMLHCDHIHPVSAGGTNDIDNLITACQPCNSGKSDVPLNLVPQSLAVMASETSEREAQIAGYQSVMKERRARLDANGQEILEMFCESFGKDGIPRRDFLSIKRFVDLIGLDEVHSAFEIAQAKKRFNYNSCFNYFCGVCWNKIKRTENL